MLDHLLEPDDEPEYVCDCEEPDCETCGRRWERSLDFDEFLFEQIGGIYVRATNY